MKGTLLIAPSSGGKSTYLRSMRERGVIANDQRIIFAFQLESADPPRLDPRSIVHVNMFHPFGNSADGADRELKDAPFMRELIRQGLPRRAIILVVPRRQLAKRILLREWTENDLPDAKHPYPRVDFFEFVNRVDLAIVYRRWVNFLREHDVSIEFVSSQNSEYQQIDLLESALTIINSTQPESYTEEEKLTALSGFSFNYHQVDGFETWTGSNQDRAGTYKLIKPYITGNTVLDIGCGLGYFSFRLEKDGIESVLGTEVKRDRFLAACAIGETIGTRCKFEYRDVLQESEIRSFDTVLMLNVLHHLQDPVNGLKSAAKQVRSTLILEYPTLGDPKFQATLREPMEFDPSLPLIGVSSIEAHDQTFVFSDEALRRILIENTNDFKQSTFMQSPIAPDRRIAIFVKEQRSVRRI